MSDTLQLLEHRLLNAYADQASHYERAFLILKRQHGLTFQNAVDESWLFDLQSALDQVSAIEIAIANDKRAWQHSGRSPGEQLRSILDILAQRIHTLAELVDGRIAVLNEKRCQMMPELDGVIRQRRMLNAYHNTRNDPAPNS